MQKQLGQLRIGTRITVMHNFAPPEIIEKRLKIAGGSD